MRLTTLIMFPAFLLCACEGTPPAAAPNPGVAAVATPATSTADEPELRTYEVPGGRAGELAGVLRSALSRGRDQPTQGTVKRLGDDRLVVVAPPSIHEGVEQLCRDFADGDEAPAPRTVTLDYWILRVGDGTAGAGNLPEALSGVVEEIAERGQSDVSLLEQLELSSVTNEHAQIEGSRAEVIHTVTVVGEQIVAEVGIELRESGSKLRTRISLEPNTFVVLGRGGYSRVGPDRDGEAETLYYVVRARV